MSEDVLGNQLNIGDRVAYAIPGNSKRLGVAEVKKLTPKGATLLVREDTKWGPEYTNRRSNQMVFIEVDQNG